MNTEQAVLCQAVQSGLPHEATGTPNFPSDDDIDWDLVYDIAINHQVVPLLHQAFKKTNRSIPANVREAVHQHAQQIARENLHFAQELTRVIDQLDGRQIPVLALKGPALAKLVYGNLADRRFVDLDIVVPEEYVTRAYTQLREMGYKPKIRGEFRDELSPTERRLIRAGGPHYTLFHPERGISVELHWRIANRRFPANPLLGRAFDSPASVRVADSEIPTLSREAYLLAATVHATKHKWGKLKWIADFAGLCSVSDHEAWATALQCADEAGLRRMLAIGVVLSRELFGVEAPATVQAELQHEPPAELVTRLQSDFLWGNNDNHPVGHGLRFELAGYHRRREKGRHLLNRLFRPTLAEGESLKLPVQLFNLYYLYRPLRIAYNTLRRVR